MLAVCCKDGVGDDAQFAEDEGYHGELEHYAHHEGERCECLHVAVERDGAVYPLRYAVGAEEAEGDGEQYIIGHEYSDDEECVDDNCHLYGVLALVLVEGRRDKSEDFVEYVGRGAEQSEIDGRGDVHHELRGEFRGYQVHVILLEVEVGEPNASYESLYPPVGAEVPFAWGEQ